MLLVDTNVFLELLLQQNRSNEAEDFLRKAGEQETILVCSSYSVHSIEYRLSTMKKWAGIEYFLSSIQKMPTLNVYQTTIHEEAVIVAIAQEKNLDFDDALQYYCAKASGCKAIVSFDRHFDKTDLKRIEPGEVFA